MTSPYDQSVALPGGLRVWRARRLLASYGGAPLSRWEIVVAALFPPAVLLVAVHVLEERYRRRGAPVTELSQPALHALVSGVARRLGVPVPDRTWLTGEAVVSVVVAGGRRHLMVGLPLVECLAREELAALVGHRLAAFRHPRAGLVSGLLAVWTDAVVEESFEDGRALRRAASVRRALDAFAVEAQRDADGAAVLAAGGVEPAARAFALARLVEQEYDSFLTDSGAPPQRWRLYESAIRDVDDGWRRVVRQGLGATGWDADEAAVLARVHPFLAAALTDLGIGPLAVTRPTRALPISALSPREQRRIVRLLHGIPYPRWVRWTTYQRSPQAWWRMRARADVRSVRADVAAVLGRDPVDDVEVFHVVHTRGGELLAAALGIPAEEMGETTADRCPDGSAEPAAALVWLLEDRLLQRGWRLDHPAVRGVLTGPAGEMIDLRELFRERHRTDAVIPAVREILTAVP